jgi:hypothetical protein
VSHHLNGFAQEAIGGSGVAVVLDPPIEHGSVPINGLRETVQLALDADEHLIQKSLVAGL